MTDINLDTMSLAVLKKLQRDVTKAMSGHEARRKAEALRALEAKAQEFGFSLAELTGTKRPRKTSGPAGPKYRHPDNPELTWSGRGRKPHWFHAATDAGTPPDTMAV